MMGGTAKRHRVPTTRHLDIAARDRHILYPIRPVTPLQEASFGHCTRWWVEDEISMGCETNPTFFPLSSPNVLSPTMLDVTNAPNQPPKERKRASLFASQDHRQYLVADLPFLALLRVGVGFLAPVWEATADDGVRSTGLDGGVGSAVVSPARGRVIVLVDIGGAKGAVKESRVAHADGAVLGVRVLDVAAGVVGDPCDG